MATINPEDNLISKNPLTPSGEEPHSPERPSFSTPYPRFLPQWGPKEGGHAVEVEDSHLEEAQQQWERRLKRMMPHLSGAALANKAFHRALDELRSLRQEAHAQETTQVAVAPPLGHSALGRNGQAFDIHTLAMHLPARKRKSLLAQFTPLAQDALPKPADLSAFWLVVDEAIRLLHPSLTHLSALTLQHVRQLAPVVLGPKGQQHHQHDVWVGSEDFKAKIKAQWGLSPAQLSARFYAMRPAQGKNSAAYTLRVKQLQRAINANKEATLHCFLLRLSPAVQQHLESVQIWKATTGAAGGGVLDWDDAVRTARDALAHQRTEPPLDSQPTWRAQPPTMLPSAPTPSSAMKPMPAGTGNKTQKMCAYCAPLGLGLDNLNQKWCYIDPKSIQA